jgi:hypothetical protein
MAASVPAVRLDAFDMIEWWDVARRINPRMTWEQFERDWQEFVALQMHDVRANDRLQAS